MAITRWMVASCRMRFWALGEQDTITFMCVHLNHMTAKKEISEGSQSLKRFWDEIVGDITKHGVRIFTGDLNMQLFPAVAELRARGLQANLAAWYPWINHLETHPRIDSCAIILIGPCEGIRMAYDCSVLGIHAPETIQGMAQHGAYHDRRQGSGDREGAFQNKIILNPGQRLSTHQLQATAHSHNEAARDMGVRGCDQEGLTRGSGGHACKRTWAWEG